MRPRRRGCSPGPVTLGRLQEELDFHRVEGEFDTAVGYRSMASMGSNNAIPVLIDGNGQLGTASSSRRVKQDIADMGEASGVLMDLRPVTFRYRSQAAAGQVALQYGLVAEEVAQVAPGLAVRSADGNIETVNYPTLVPMLLNELQKQQRVIETQALRLERLEAALGMR